MFARYGDRFAERVLSERELTEYRNRRQSGAIAGRNALPRRRRLPRRSAAGCGEPVSLRRISVTHDGLGKPVLQFDETLRKYLAQLGIGATSSF